MNVIKVYGGLGNQFFQYAFGKTLEAHGSKIGFDTLWFNKPQDPPRPYRLHKFATKVPFGGVHPDNKKVYEKTALYYGFDPSLLDMKDTTFQGYWQNIGYLKEVLPILQHDLRLRKEEYTQSYVDYREQIICSDSISLHVRRGDYVSINGHHLLPIEYYAEALVRIGDQIGLNIQIFVFSDDLPWCKEKMGLNDHITYVDEEDYLAFDLMRLCKHNIIANSTFSWWAAFLNNNPDKIVVAPIKWRENEQEQKMLDAQGLVQPNWIRI